MNEDFGRFANTYDNVTTLHPIGAALLIAAIVAIFALRRDWIFLPIIILTCLVPASQRIVVLGGDFYFLRIATVAGLLRIWARGESRPLRWTMLDKCVIAYVIVITLAGVLRRFSFSKLINALGGGFDTLGLYFLARLVIRDWRDVETLARSFAIASIPVAYFAIQELRTGRNPFSFYPGVPEFVVIRDGRIRLRGAFAHQILAGCYWVVPAILSVGLLLQRRTRFVLPVIGISLSLFLVVASASSTPALGLVLAVIAGCLWPLRHRMRNVRWGIFAGLLVLQLIMGKPIWHLYQRAAALGVGGSTGYHRYRLIDAFVNKFSQWALLGVNTTASWGRQLEDVTNHFILQGVRGGLVAFLIFIAIFVYAFSQLGAIRMAWSGDPRRAAFAWVLGVAVFVQMVMMTSVSYFGQILLVLWVTFGAIASLTPERRGRSKNGAPPRRPGSPRPANGDRVGSGKREVAALTVAAGES